MDPNGATELIQATGAVAAVVRLVYLKLAKRFPALVAYLVFLAVIDTDFGLLSEVSARYFWSYIVLEPLLCLLGVIAVRQLLTLTFNEYPGIRSAGSWVMYAAVALGLGISVLVTGFFWSGGVDGRAHSHLFYFEAFKRSIVFSLAFVIVAILLFLSKYPLHLDRNTVVSSVFFSILFLSEAARLLVDSLVPNLYNRSVDWAESGVISICLFGWAILLQPETAKARPQVRFSTPQENHLLQQLDSLNQLMTRSVRR